MKKKTKKILVLLMAATMMIGMCACGEAEEPDFDDSDSNVQNPIHECTYEEMLQTTGIDIAAPEEAEDVKYAYIDITSNGEDPIAQVEFEYGDKEYCYRAQSTGVTSMNADIDGNEISADKLMESLKDCTNAGAALAGMYCDWEASALIDVAGRDGVCAFNIGDEGMIAWLDVVPGFMYSLTIEDDANQEDMMAMAEMLFVPMQGDVE